MPFSLFSNLVDIWEGQSKKYTRVVVKTTTVLNEFVEKIIVHAPDKSSGKQVQQVEIHYNCVGMIELPNETETNRKTA